MKDVRAEITEYMRERAPRPTLLGPLTIHLGSCLSIAQVDEMVAGMVDAGKVRKATAEELAAFDVLEGFFPV